MAKKDKILRGLVSKYQGLRLLGIPNLFEALSWAIIGQQINLTFAFKVKRQLVESYGEQILFKNRIYYAFPRPEVVAKATIADLKKMQFSKQKTEYIINLAHVFARNEISKDQLLKIGNHKEIKERLTQLRGIGPWTAEYALMKSFKYSSAFPVDDVGLQNAIKIQQGSTLKPSKEELYKLAKSWKGFEAYATFYLWRSLSS